MVESLRSLRWSWIGFGWFISVALASLILLALEAFDVVQTEGPAEGLWVGLALLIGFTVVGAFVGTRVAAAPIMHGIAIGLCSLVAWIAVNLIVGEAIGDTTWGSLDPGLSAGLLLLQTAAAVVGTRIGVRWVRSSTAG